MCVLNRDPKTDAWTIKICAVSQPYIKDIQFTLLNLVLKQTVALCCVPSGLNFDFSHIDSVLINSSLQPYRLCGVVLGESLFPWCHLVFPPVMNLKLFGHVYYLLYLPITHFPWKCFGNDIVTVLAVTHLSPAPHPLTSSLDK